MDTPIKIIDLFAGPGGLGEGFSSLRDNKGDPFFKIALSIEKEKSAYKTLTLRAFYRQFPPTSVPPEYYDFLHGKLGNDPFEQLFNIPELKKYAKYATDEAKCLTLGKDNDEIHTLISKALGQDSQPWVLIGGPPCQAYSMVGRSRNKGNSLYSAESDHRSFLYLEYLKVISKFQPTVFVMENVKGMLSAKINGEKIIDDILKDLKKPTSRIESNDSDIEYEIFSLSKEVSGEPEPSDFLIKSEDYGIPQARHRVILLGVRKDYLIELKPEILKKSPDKIVSVRDVICDLPRVRSGLSREEDTNETWIRAINQSIKPVLEELENTKQFLIAEEIKKSLQKMTGKPLSRGQNWAQKSISNKEPKKLLAWYQDPSYKKLVCNHDTRTHIRDDLIRYLLCSAYGRCESVTPNATKFPESLAPKHKNWSSGNFSDRFRVQIADKPSKTIMSHIAKDGHYYIHYDPSQSRSLTVREAARLQTFPDNYFFVGNRTEQYVQVGNAVPPYLAIQIAKIVSKLF
mgnify:CR=1 FL=1